MDEMRGHREAIEDLAKGVKRKGQPGYHRVKRQLKGGKTRWEWVHESKLEAHEVGASPVNQEREDFLARYQITSAKGLLYDRPALRAYVRRGMRGLPKEHIDEALALIDDPAWLRSRRGMTPQGVLHEVNGHLYGHGSAAAAQPKPEPAPSTPTPAKKGRAPKGTPTGTNIYALHDVLRQSPDGLVPRRVHATDHPHLERCFRAGLLERHEGSLGKLRLTQAGVEALKAHGHEPHPAALAHVRSGGEA